MGRRGVALESAAMCREAGARVISIVLDKEVPNALDGRRLEVVADGLPTARRRNCSQVGSHNRWCGLRQRPATEGADVP